MHCADRLLKNLEIDADSIRLDCRAEWFRDHLERFAVCGVHLATEHEVADLGYLEDAIIPNRALPLEPHHLDLLTPFLADGDTQEGLCVSFGEADLNAPVVSRMLQEASGPGFQPHLGRVHTLGPFQGRLIDVLTAEPNTMTTTVLDRRIQHYSERRQGTWVGMHYDNALTEDGHGERFPRKTRVDLADRRLLFNTGPGPRRLVVALAMSAVSLSEKVRPGDELNIPDTRQLRSYLREDPAAVESTTCLVTTLKPGEYIVFPAGVAIHDGSMDGFQESSSAIVLGGRFPRASR